MANNILSNYIDIKNLEVIQNNFFKLTGISSMVIGTDGDLILEESGFSVVASTTGKKVSAVTEKLSKSALASSRYSRRGASFFKLGGFNNFSVPIIIEDNVVAYFVGGYILTSSAELIDADDVASEFSITEKAATDLLEKTVHIEKNKFTDAADFISCILDTITTNLSANGVSSATVEDSSIDTSDLSAESVAKLAGAQKSVKNASKKINTIASTFAKIDELVINTTEEIESTDETLKQIQDVTLNTKILGFNASIEASRAKEAGKGFGVIAQEVRTLSETSKISTDRIKQIITKIADYNKEMNTEVASIKTMINQCAGEFNKFSAMIEQINADEE